MRYEYLVWVHVVIGSAALAFFWRAMLAVKGSVPHRRGGRCFFLAMLATVATVGPVILLRPVPFDPGWVVSLVYLTVCVVTVVTVGWTAIRWKTDPERFRGAHFKLLGPVITALGALVLAAGLAKGDPVATVLSWVGLVYGPAMIYFAWTRAPLHPKWWLNWHLNAICGLFTAVHGTLLFVAWRWAFAPEATRSDAAMWHAGVLVAGLALRWWWGRRRDVPWRFFLSPVSAVRSA